MSFGSLALTFVLPVLLKGPGPVEPAARTELAITAPGCTACPGDSLTCNGNSPGEPEETLVRELIATLNETNSRDTFRLTMQVLASLKGEARKQAIPAILKSAERLGISKAMGEDSSKWNRDQQALAALVQPDLESLRRKLQQRVPAAKVEPVLAANGGCVLTGAVTKAEDVPVVLAVAQSVVGAKVVNALRVEGVPQVQLDVVLAEVSARDLPLVSAVLTDKSAVGAAAARDLSPVGFAERDQLLEVLQTLRRQGRAKVLASPRLLTLSGRPARFQSGGQLPVSVEQCSGTKTVRFANFGTEIDFLPTILDNGKIHLEGTFTESTLAGNKRVTISGTTVPAFDAQRFPFSVEAKFGQTVAITALTPKGLNARVDSEATRLLIVVTLYRVAPTAGDRPPE